jgi:hypothetical protein
MESTHKAQRGSPLLILSSRPILPRVAQASTPNLTNWIGESMNW